MSSVVQPSSGAGGAAGIRRPNSIEEARRNACLIAQVCFEFRGLDVLVLDLTQITPLFDFFVIATGNSRRQNHAMANTSDDVMAAHDSPRRGTEGMEGPWICHDYGDVVLHVFMPEAREHYDLENLWADAPRVDWQAELAKQEKSK